MWGKWAQLETLLHEQIHLWQENFGQHKHKPGRVAHDKEFVEKCRSLGLYPTPVIGSHYQVADGVFAELMKELGMPRPNDVPRDATTDWTKTGGRKTDWFRPFKEKGRSTLHKYEYPNCGLKVRVGVKEDPGLIHVKCGTLLVKADGLEDTIYQA